MSPESEVYNQTQPWRQRVARLLLGELGPLLALLAMVLVFGIADQFPEHGGHFFSVYVFRLMLASTATVAVAALGMTVIIIAGGIDLSAGTALALVAIVMAYLLKHDYHVVVALLVTVATGCLCGLLNGAPISTLRVVPFIVTLGTMTLFLGFGKILSKHTTISPDTTQIPEWLNRFCSTRGPNLVGGVFPNIATGVWVAFALAAAMAAVLRYTVFGRRIFALGSNELTARLCGIPVGRTKVALYTFAGLFTGLAGVYSFSLLSIGDPTSGPGKELQIIAAVVIGGGSLNGGRGSVLGTLTGAAIMGVIDSGCKQLALPDAVTNIITGMVIIAAVTADQVRQRMLKD